MSDMQQGYDRIIHPIEDRMIRSIWRIVHNAQDAEDAMQEALLTIAKRWDRIARHPSPQSLVLKICIDAAYDLTRRRMRQRRTVELAEAGDCRGDSSSLPSDAIASAEQYAEIMAAIQRLSRHQAVAMLMRVVQDQSYEQIAAVLGCSEATARKHVARSRQRLRIWLSHLDPKSAARSSS
jgi:RNA polymerase sigma factor (sigma-70 family)